MGLGRKPQGAVQSPVGPPGDLEADQCLPAISFADAPRRQLLCPARPGGSPPWAWPGAHLWSAGASPRGPPRWPRVARRRQGLWEGGALCMCPRLPAGGEPRPLCGTLLAWDSPHPRSCLRRGGGERVRPGFQGEAGFAGETPGSQREAALSPRASGRDGMGRAAAP